MQAPLGGSAERNETQLWGAGAHRRTIRRLCAAALITGLAALAPISASTALSQGPMAATPGPGYLTIQFGRSIWTVAYQCKQVAGALTLVDVANDLKAHAMSATGTVVVDRTNRTGRLCEGGNLYSNWSDLARLRDTYGWQFVSNGLTHDDITGMSPEEQAEETCDTLDTFTAHGFNSAWGLYAYGDNHFTTAIQKNLVSSCFGFGRTYRGGVNMRATTIAPWFQKTNSILGGDCNIVGQPCYILKSTGGQHYQSPLTFANLVAGEGKDQWIDLQFYRLVTGSSHLTPAYSWDCTNSNWKLHWTSSIEMYCQNDFDSILSHVVPGVIVADPATVAMAWGHHPDN